MPGGMFHYNTLDWSISNSKVSGYFLLLLYLCFIEIPELDAVNLDPVQTPHSVES